MSVTVTEVSPDNWAVMVDGEVKIDGFPDQAAAWREEPLAGNLRERYALPI